MSDSRDQDDPRRPRRRDGEGSGDDRRGAGSGRGDAQDRRGPGGGFRDATSRRDGASGRPRRDGEAAGRPRRENDPRAGGRREGDASFRPRRDGDGSFRPRRDGDGAFRPRREGDGGFRPRRDGDGGFRPRSDGDASARGDRSGRPGSDRGSFRPRRDDRGDRSRPDDRGAQRPRRDDATERPRRDDGRSFRPGGGDTGRAEGRPPFRSRSGERVDGDRRADRGRFGEGGAGRRSADRGGRFPGSDRPARDSRPGRDDRFRRADGPDERRSAPGRHLDEPQLPDDVRAADLDKAARGELRTLSKDNADAVARHLVMAGRLVEEDPAEAHRHALAAARRAGRVAVVRESVAITAYATGDFALALRELRTFRRISGSDDQIGLMVDSERGVGRPDRALELGRSVDREALPLEAQVALAIAMSGARLDLQDPQGALDELERVPVDLQRVHPWSPTLFEALSAVHEDLGDADAAAVWARRAERAEALLAEVDEESSSVVVSSEAVEDAEHGDDDEPAGPPSAEQPSDAQRAAAVEASSDPQAAVDDQPHAGGAPEPEPEPETAAEPEPEPRAQAASGPEVRPDAAPAPDRDQD